MRSAAMRRTSLNSYALTIWTERNGMTADPKQPQPPDGRPPLDMPETANDSSTETGKPVVERSLADMATDLRRQLGQDQRRRSARLKRR